MAGAIGYSLKNLTNFNGRDGRKRFLSYFLFVVILNLVLYLAASIPTIMAAMDAGIEAAKTGDNSTAETAIMNHMIDFAGTLVWISLGIALLNTVLLSAAFVRRAHDTGLPGLLLAIPLGLQLVWMFFAYRQLDGLEATMRAAVDAQMAGQSPEVQTGMIAQDLIGWLVVIIVLVIGFLKTQRSENQYGEPNLEG
ncbi:DUF805 domain-containing protein [Altererythrobacter luteolus]|uniref:DUF805 domain-containing protein n=1 Tax=Pontixanthobacter luteolus TaxID=295089 RepID=A0A6I4V068_9SPHN|nr:DUF805 domain-containing protein [Pontixanthobacter luteolus]MXP46631.1 DUF805 domain-containing protein [Pontixanthobacter luteolus]